MDLKLVGASGPPEAAGLSKSQGLETTRSVISATPVHLLEHRFHSSSMVRRKVKVASMDLTQYVGTGITLTGETNATYQVVLDGTEAAVNSSEKILYSRDGLELGDHSITLTLLDASNNGMLWFWDAVIATSRLALGSFRSSQYSFQRYSPTALKSAVHPSYDDRVIYNGTWYHMSIPQGTWASTSEYRARASLTFANTHAVAIHSPLNWGHWSYAIELDGTIIQPPNQETFNGSSYWLIPDSIVFFQDNLDSSKEHTLSIIHLGNHRSLNLTLTSFEVWQVDDTVYVLTLQRVSWCSH